MDPSTDRVDQVKLWRSFKRQSYPRSTRIRCIINNELGKWIAKRAISVEPTTNNLAELEALQEGLPICLDIGLTKIIIEGDS